MTLTFKVFFFKSFNFSIILTKLLPYLSLAIIICTLKLETLYLLPQYDFHGVIKRLTANIWTEDQNLLLIATNDLRYLVLFCESPVNMVTIFLLVCAGAAFFDEIRCNAEIVIPHRIWRVWNLAPANKPPISNHSFLYFKMEILFMFFYYTHPHGTLRSYK